MTYQFSSGLGDAVDMAVLLGSEPSKAANALAWRANAAGDGTIYSVDSALSCLDSLLCGSNWALMGRSESVSFCTLFGWPLSKAQS